jgi:hypothetical protein
MLKHVRSSSRQFTPFTHPLVVGVHGCGSDGGSDFGVMGTTHLVLLAIVWNIVDQKQRRLLILDDAQYTDDYSWVVLEDLVSVLCMIQSDGFTGWVFGSFSRSSSRLVPRAMPSRVCVFKFQEVTCIARLVCMCVSAARRPMVRPHAAALSATATSLTRTWRPCDCPTACRRELR